MRAADSVQRQFFPWNYTYCVQRTAGPIFTADDEQILFSLNYRIVLIARKPQHGRPHIMRFETDQRSNVGRSEYPQFQRQLAVDVLPTFWVSLMKLPLFRRTNPWIYGNTASLSLSKTVCYKLKWFYFEIHSDIIRDMRLTDGFNCCMRTNLSSVPKNARLPSTSCSIHRINALKTNSSE